MAFEFMDGRTDDIENWKIHGGAPIPIQDKSTAEYALEQVKKIYADAGHAMDDGDIRQLEGRIKGGQSLADIVANTYDEAQRRFIVEDTPQSRREEEQGLRPTYDSQLNQGRSFDPPAVMLEQLVMPARQVADMQEAWPATSPVMAAPQNTPMHNQGPAGSALGGSASILSADGGIPWGLILIAGGVALGAYVLLRKKRR